MSTDFNKLQNFLRAGGDLDSDTRIEERVVDRGYASRASVDECVLEQNRLAEKGEACTLEELLLRRKHIDRSKFLELAMELDRPVKVCLPCGRIYDDGLEACVLCGEELAEPAPRKLGKYILIREIGRGGTAVVYEAEDPELKRHVALKILRNQETGLMQRLHREAMIAAQLQHPNIVPIHEVSMVRDASGQAQHFIAMDLVEGRTLADLVRDGDRKELLRILETVSRAVGHAHSKGVIHRDLKPANVLVEEGGRVLLTDFGLARADSFHTKITGPNVMMGTPAYMAPEQVRSEDARPETDVYALGVILYEILTREMPFVGGTAGALFQRILESEPRRPKRIDSTIDTDLELICLRAMSREPERRYADAGELADDLHRFLEGRAVEARPPSAMYLLRKKLLKRKGIVIASAVGIAAVILISALVIPPWVEEVRARRRMEEARIPLEEGRKLLEQISHAKREPGYRIASLVEIANKAEEKFREVLHRVPDHPEAWLGLGRTRAAAFDDKGALENLDKAVKADPEFASPYLERARVRFRTIIREIGHPESGMDRAPEQKKLIRGDLEAASRLSRDNHEILFCRGMLAFIDADYAEAQDQLSRYVRERRGDEWAWHYLGHALLHLKRPEEAETAIRSSIRCDTRMASAYFDLSLVRQMQGDDKGALEELEKAGRLLPPSTSFHLNRGKLLDDLGRTQAALTDYMEVTKLAPEDPRGWYSCGNMYRKLRRAVPAVDCYTEALRVSPEFYPALVSRGIVRESIGEVDKAIEDYSRAMEIRPEHPDAWFGRGNAWMKKGELNRAIDDFTRAVGYRNDHAGAWLNRGSAHSRIGDWAAALSDYNQAIRIDSTIPQAYFNRAMTLVQLNRPNEALEDYARVLRLSPRNVKAYRQRGFLRLSMGDREGAVDDLQSALKFAPPGWRYAEAVRNKLRELGE